MIRFAAGCVLGFLLVALWVKDPATAAAVWHDTAHVVGIAVTWVGQLVKHGLGITH